MRLTLMNTAAGLVPMYEDGWEERRRLKLGEAYEAEIRPARNIRLHRLYFALVAAAWECLPEGARAGFRSREAFRKYIEVAAGWFEPFFSPVRGEWLEIPKSVAFDKMDDAEFRELYERVKDVVVRVLDGYMTREDFDRVLGNF